MVKKINFITHLSMLRLLGAALLVFNSTSCKKTTSEGHSDPVLSRSFDKPNFLILIADDTGWNDVGYHGSEIQTPTLDSLADTGLTLERFYTYPTCSPSRAAFLTGRPASRMGIVAPISGRSEKKLPDTIATLPQALKKVGYDTALMGKWHLGLKPESGPLAYGFDYSYGFLHGQIDQYEHTYKNGDSSWYKNGKFITEEGHATDLITKEAVNYLKDRKADSPFFLQVAYSAPHTPLQEPAYWLDQYKQIEDSSRRAYAAAMAHLDHGIGQVLEALKKKELAENTVVLFISDNGAQENWIPGDHLYDGKFEPNLTLGSNKPLRDFKTSNYEGAIRVPAIISWQGEIPEGQSTNYINVTDWMPTLLDWAGVEEIPETVEGQNLTNLLTAQDGERSKPIYIRGHLQESLIVKPFKLVRTRHLSAPAELELYHLENDVSETKNIIKENPQIANELLAILQSEFAKDDQNVNVPLRN